jgi:hypothetical protein
MTMIYDKGEEYCYTENHQEFLGSSVGVILCDRGENDHHIMCRFATEDDEFWHLSEDRFSAYWLKDLLEQLQKASVWVQTNAITIETRYGPDSFQFPRENAKQVAVIDKNYYDFLIDSYKETKGSNPETDFSDKEKD